MAWICVCQSPCEDIWKLLLTEGTTAEMNIITSGSIFCLYPALTVKGAFFENELLGGHQHSSKRTLLHKAHLLNCAASAQDLGLPCGILREYNWRTTRNMAGVGQLIWNPELDVDLGYATYKWRLTELCTNGFCANFLLPPIDAFKNCHPFDITFYMNKPVHFTGAPQNSFDLQVLTSS